MTNQQNEASSGQKALSSNRRVVVREIIKPIDEAGRQDMIRHLEDLLMRVYAGEVTGIAYAAFYGPEYDYAALGRVVKRPEYMLGILEMLAHDIRTRIAENY